MGRHITSRCKYRPLLREPLEPYYTTFGIPTRCTTMELVRLHFERYSRTFLRGTCFHSSYRNIFSSLFWAAFLKKDTDTLFWNFSYLLCIQILTGLLFTSVLAAGLSLALFSTDTLFGCEFKSEMYSNIHVLCYTLFFPFYLLGNIPIASITETKVRPFAQAWKILGLYILFPLLILYGTILYAYLTKIIIQWQLPDGWVSALVSILTIGGAITLLCYIRYAHKRIVP